MQLPEQREGLFQFQNYSARVNSCVLPDSNCCRVNVAEVIAHKDRNVAISKTQYDIALLKLAQKIDMNIFTPACLPKIKTKYIGEEGVSAGETTWG